jgi:hypothetical protein
MEPEQSDFNKTEHTSNELSKQQQLYNTILREDEIRDPTAKRAPANKVTGCSKTRICKFKSDLAGQFKLHNMFWNSNSDASDNCLVVHTKPIRFLRVQSRKNSNKRSDRLSFRSFMTDRSLTQIYDFQLGIQRSGSS